MRVDVVVGLVGVVGGTWTLAEGTPIVGEGVRSRLSSSRAGSYNEDAHLPACNAELCETERAGRSGTSAHDIERQWLISTYRKKAEQAPAREAIQNERQKGVDVGGVLGQRGGPANPVDKDNYPNAGN